MVVTACLAHTGTPAEAKLAQLASGCAAVVVCRASPSQKAAIVRRMKRFRIEQCEVHLFVARAAQAVIRSAQFLRCHLPLEIAILFYAALFCHLADDLFFLLFMLILVTGTWP